MPALVNSSVGSLAGTSELDATTAWPLVRKNSRNALRTSAAFMAGENYHAVADLVEVADGDKTAEVTVASAPDILGHRVVVARRRLRAGPPEVEADGLAAHRHPREHAGGQHV